MRTAFGPGHAFDAAVTRENLAQVYQSKLDVDSALRVRSEGKENDTLCCAHYNVRSINHISPFSLVNQYIRSAKNRPFVLKNFTTAAPVEHVLTSPDASDAYVLSFLSSFPPIVAKSVRSAGADFPSGYFYSDSPYNSFLENGLESAAQAAVQGPQRPHGRASPQVKTYRGEVSTLTLTDCLLRVAPCCFIYCIYICALQTSGFDDHSELPNQHCNTESGFDDLTAGDLQVSKSPNNLYT
jgi:hypothetical protein